MWKVLVADDEPFLREGLKKLISWEELGYQLAGAYRNGKELLDAIPEKSPDLVIVDIEMPVMNGLEAAELIHKKWPEIVVVVLTAYAEFEYAQKAIFCGVRSYVLKSNLLEDLTAALNDMKEIIEKYHQFLQKKNNYGEGLSENELVQSEEQRDELILLVNQYVEGHLEQKLSLDDIARAVHVNRTYLSRIYKQRTGENLFEMINRCRVEKAKEYIWQGNKKIYEIASLVGLDETAYFSKMFKRYVGCSPKEYERLILKKRGSQ